MTTSAIETMKMIDDFEAKEGPIMEEQSEKLKRAQFHQTALTEFVNRLQNEKDEDELEFLRGRIQFHRDRLRSLLG